jgi:hypothetical protein
MGGCVLPMMQATEATMTPLRARPIRRLHLHSSLLCDQIDPP